MRRARNPRAVERSPKALAGGLALRTSSTMTGCNRGPGTSWGIEVSQPISQNPIRQSRTFHRGQGPHRQGAQVYRCSTLGEMCRGCRGLSLVMSTLGAGARRRMGTNHPRRGAWPCLRPHAVRRVTGLPRNPTTHHQRGLHHLRGAHLHLSCPAYIALRETPSASPRQRLRQMVLGYTQKEHAGRRRMSSLPRPPTKSPRGERPRQRRLQPSSSVSGLQLILAPHDWILRLNWQSIRCMRRRAKKLDKLRSHSYKRNFINMPTRRR